MELISKESLQHPVVFLAARLRLAHFLAASLQDAYFDGLWRAFDPLDEEAAAAFRADQNKRRETFDTFWVETMRPLRRDLWDFVHRGKIPPVPTADEIDQAWAHLPAHFKAPSWEEATLTFPESGPVALSASFLALVRTHLTAPPEFSWTSMGHSDREIGLMKSGQLIAVFSVTVSRDRPDRLRIVVGCTAVFLQVGNETPSMLTGALAAKVAETVQRVVRSWFGPDKPFLDVECHT